MALIYKIKSLKCFVEVKKNDDGTVTLFYAGGKPVDYNRTATMIKTYNGIDGFLSKCFEINTTLDEYIKEYMLKEQEYKKLKAERARLKGEQEFNEAEKKYNELTAKYDVIPATRENLAIIAKYLIAQNWGSWHLPQLSVGYTANQYDCDGRIAVTFTLDEAVDGEKKIVFGAPRGHLTNYTHWSL